VLSRGFRSRNPLKQSSNSLLALAAAEARALPDGSGDGSNDEADGTAADEERNSSNNSSRRRRSSSSSSARRQLPESAVGSEERFLDVVSALTKQVIHFSVVS
jgi:hypothetical protein